MAVKAVIKTAPPATQPRGWRVHCGTVTASVGGQMRSLSPGRRGQSARPAGHALASAAARRVAVAKLGAVARVCSDGGAERVVRPRCAPAVSWRKDGKTTRPVSRASRDAPAGPILEKHEVAHPGAHRGIEGDLPGSP